MINLSLFLPFRPLLPVLLNKVPDDGHDGGALILPLKLQGLLLQEKYCSSVSSMVVFPYSLYSQLPQCGFSV